MNPIASENQLEQAALRFGLLPFFSNDIAGYSVEEMCAPGMLFGGNAGYDGCWEWKGPVIQRQTLAYGKFFRRKAGFVVLSLLPDFLNYRRSTYPVAPETAEETILQTIRSHEGLTSSELRKFFGTERRNSLEGPLQRLQMGGHILIADFQYKFSRTGERYGWGVALYSTPEIWFDRPFPLPDRSPAESLDLLVEHLSHRLPEADPQTIRSLLR